MRIRTAIAILVTTLGLEWMSKPQSDRFWEREIEQAKTIRAKKGSVAARDYLLDLPAKLAPGRHATRNGDFRRIKQLATFEDESTLWDDADRHWQECIRAKSEENGRDAATLQLLRFSTLFKLRRYAEAQECLSAAQRYIAVSHDTSLKPFVLYNSGRLLVESGRLEESIAPFTQSLAYYVKTKQQNKAALARVAIARALYQLGRYDQALDLLEVGIGQAESKDQPLILGHLGNLAYEHGDLAKAISYYHTAGAGNPAIRATWLTNEASVWIDLRNCEKGAELNAQAALSRTFHVAKSPQAKLNEARIAACRGDSISSIAQLREIVKSSDDPSVTVDAYAELCQLFDKSGKESAARTAYADGLQMADKKLDELRDPENKISFQAKAKRLNDLYIAALMSHGRTQEAFEVAAASRARILSHSLQLTAGSSAGASVAAYKRAAGRTDSAYLAYWIAPDHSFLWVITGSGFRSYALPGEAKLQRDINRFQQLIQERDNSDREGAELFRTLVGPALHQIGRARKIVVAPDGPLYGLNLETLRQGAPDAPYWLEQATVTIAPILSVVLSGTKPSALNSGILLVGNAQEWDANFPRLLNSGRELDLIAAHFPTGRRTRLVDANANPVGYQQQVESGYRYIHFATHAAANRDAPLESAIVLSQKDGSGMLTARRVLDKPVTAEMVSISACRSAGGKTYAGEGLVGLAWAFLHAGAHSVVAGLWDVSDHSSPLLMDKLYAGLANGKEASEALREAKLELLKGQYPDPYYWGPFLLYQGAGSK